MAFSSSLYASNSPFWYNGDPNLLDGLRESVGGMGPSLTYDDFIVGSAGVTVSAVFSDDFMNASITQAYWEIRSGVSDGNGGTLVASGTGSATQTDTGLSAFGFDVYRVEVDGLNLFLPSGHYWLAVAPVLDSSTQSSFISTTSGTNGVGYQQAWNGLSYFNSAFFGANFAAASGQLGPQSTDGGHIDFSEGIYGTVQTPPQPTPEPATAGFALAGLLIAFAARRRSAV